jgi:FixJ family two-component response regulator
MRLPTIVSTGYSTEESRAGAVARGAVVYLQKPVGERSLFDVIAYAMSRCSG